MVRQLFVNTGEEKVDPAEEVKQCVVDFNQCDKQLRIAYIGAPGHGKSSTQNSTSSYACNPPRVKQVARVGCGEGNITKAFTEHALEVWDPASGKNVQSGIIMVDTPGKVCKDLRLEYEKHEHSHRQEEIITGMILERIVWPLQRAGATAIVAVISAEQVWNEAKRNTTQLERLKGGPVDLKIPDDSVVHKSIQMLRKILSAGGDVCMRPICVVTNVDLADKAVGRALRKLPTSSRIKSIRAYISAQLGLNLNLVHPMVNLRNEFDPASNMELGRVALTTFRHVLQAAEDGYLERAANPPQPPPPPVPEADNIKANSHTELHMVRCMAHSNVLPM